MENSSEKINENIPTLNIGMVGHIDHGKTTFLSKLTGKWTDTHSEELKRGITIKLGYADTVIEMNGKKRYVSFIDCPGHEMLMATMLSGAALIDSAILLIAANEGIMPQTKEHLMALQTKNIKDIIIVQNKIDLVSKEEAIKNYKEIKNFVKGTIAENAPIIPVSAQQGINLEKVKEAIMNFKEPVRDVESAPEFLIARSFDINRPGTKIQNVRGGVLGGILKKGILKVGDQIEIKPGISEKKSNQFVYTVLKTKIVSIHLGSKSVEKALPGVSIAIETQLDNILTKGDNLSGCIASLVGKLPDITNSLKLEYSLFEEVFGAKEKIKIEGLRMSENIMMSINTTITVGQITKIKNKNIEVLLRIPVVPIKGDNLGIARNIGGHWRLIGHAKII